MEGLTETSLLPSLWVDRVQSFHRRFCDRVPGRVVSRLAPDSLVARRDEMTTLHCLARPTKPTRERLQGALPQACVERDDGGRRDLLALSIKEERLPEHPEHTQTSRETCGDCAGRGAVESAGRRATCDEFETRHSKNKASDTCGLVVRRH